LYNRSIPPWSHPPAPAAKTATARAPTSPRPAAILLAAERLFAEHGYHAVSIRQIAHWKPQVPLALVGYYYGQKHELFHAIFAHWRGTISERLALLARPRRAPRTAHTCGASCEAFVSRCCAMRASSEGEYYALLVARELAYRTPEAERVLADYFDPMAHAFIDGLARGLPGQHARRRAWAYQFAMGALLHHLIDHRVERLSRAPTRPTTRRPPACSSAFITAGIGALLLPAHRVPPVPSTHNTITPRRQTCTAVHPAPLPWPPLPWLRHRRRHAQQTIGSRRPAAIRRCSCGSSSSTNCSFPRWTSAWPPPAARQDRLDARPGAAR
jgi:AcrR family transcriptional regulator